MAIESTTSPLSSYNIEPVSKVEGANDQDDHEEQEEAVEPRTPVERPKAKSRLANLVAQIDDINLARYLSDQELAEIGELCLREYRIDDQSRDDWCVNAEASMRLATLESAPKQYPWPDASSMVWPLVTQASLEFAARMYPSIVQGRNIVKGVVWGTDDGTPITDDGKPDGKPVTIEGPDGQQQPVWLIKPGEKRALADKIGEHMSWQLLEEMPEWEPQTDQLLHQIPVIGGAIRKTFRDKVENRNKSLFVGLLNIVWNYSTPSFEAAPRISEKILLYPSQITDLERAGCEDDSDETDENAGGMFLHITYGVGGGSEGEKFDGKPIYAGDNSDDDAPHLFIEQHRLLDLDDDGYPEPYIVTVHVRSAKTVRIVARYDEEGIKASKDGRTIYKIDPVLHYTLYRFFPNLDGGSYPMGFGHVLGSLNEAINSTLNQMFDAGTLQNAGGGFISDQLGIPSGQTLFQVGKFARVTTKGQAIRDAVYPIDFKGASPVLFQLLGVVIGAGKELASIGNILTGDAAVANAPPTTVLALIEQGLKLYNALAKRIFLAEKAELKKLHRLNKVHITEPQRYQIGDESREVEPDDYARSGGVVPVADPTMTTDMQRLGRAQVLMSTKDEPGVDRLAIIRRFYEAANIEQIDDLFAKPDTHSEQMRSQMMQLELDMKQAELGAVRADELKNQTQAFLNMAKARESADAKSMEFIEKQLTYLRLHIEAINAATSAAMADHRFHDTDTRDRTARAGIAAKHALEMAKTTPKVEGPIKDAIDGLKDGGPPSDGGPPPGPPPSFAPPPSGEFPVEPGPASGPPGGPPAGPPAGPAPMAPAGPPMVPA